MPRVSPYLQVVDSLRARIEAGEWAIGDKLPSRARFADEYAVGQSVTQRAMEQLIIEGFLEGRAGSGTYVRTPRRRMRMLRTRRRVPGAGNTFRSEAAAHGIAASWDSRTVPQAPAPERIAARLAIEPGAPCVMTRYEFMADGSPAELSESWEPLAITAGTPVVLPEEGEMRGAGVVARMRSIGITVASVVEVPRPSRADQNQANLLGISLGSLITQIERTYIDVDGRPVETADLVIPDSRYEIAYAFPVD
ncbi:GntR family transcriptional regulator [Streptomyces lavendulae]|uniref:GntR family transcriptional regulator n=1 Tax=Streptomyces TaxID=1883 RepID=UPI0024759D41|nr:GntR family transcriptional regulator [Streptomyces sp. SPB4]MDH6544556.1 GntR family transcriptional regulator [Streptomyces sp. SPB4]GLX35177.1 GntR family transcriptional regulator [Streptomyces roseochromogenus]